MTTQMDHSTYQIIDGLTQKQREFPALLESAIPLIELNWTHVFALIREYSMNSSLYSVFQGKELTVFAILLSIELDHPATYSALEKGAGVPGLSKLLVYCLQDLKYSQTATGNELYAFILNLLNGLRQKGIENDKKPNEVASWMQALSMTQSRARQLMPQLLRSGQNEPALSLYTVFAHLLEHLYSTINRFPTRRIDFYYNEMLGESLRPASPEKIHLVLPVASENGPIVLPAGSEFVAGSDASGTEILFATQDSIELNDVKVVDLRTLSLKKGAFWEDRIPVYTPAMAMAAPSMSPCPLFGSTRDHSKPAQARDARVGFALASTVLLMREGERRITIQFEYEPHPHTLSLENLRSAFNIAITGTQGWIRIQEYLPSTHRQNAALPPHSLQLDMLLSADATPVIPYHPGIHGENWQCVLPVLRLEVNPQSNSDSQILFQNLVIKDVRIHVDVKNCTDLILHNQMGPLSPLAPFQPFGPIPALGDYLLVGCSETRSKNLTDFRVKIEWGGLPEGVHQFADWYHGYSKAPATADFVARLFALSDGRWYPGEEEATVMAYLFDTAYPTRSGMDSHAEISCENILSAARSGERTLFDQDLNYGPGSKNGFFKIALAGPSGAFQHQAYPHLLAQTLTYNARVKSEHLARAIPNAPYTPTIASIKVDYKACALFTPRHRLPEQSSSFHDQMFYLHPWGFENALDTRVAPLTQIPFYAEGGALHIGMEFNRHPREFSLYFHLNRDSDWIPPHIDKSITWWYLASSGWTLLPAVQILHDSTAHFTNSGIITLSLPKDICNQNPQMPLGKYWLRICAADDVLHCCRAFSIYAQAVTAVQTQGFASKPNAELSHAKVCKLRRSIAGLSEALQLAPTWGGQSPEQIHALRIRMAERLSHKNRALCAHDYERIILQNFPEVYKVKCFAGINPDFPHRSSPGHILLVPLSHLYSDGRRQIKPRLSGKTLRAIQELIEEHAPKQVALHIVNPYFEHIQVRCAVRFHDNRNKGYFLDKLDNDISTYISPWHEPGYQTHFGWCIRRYDIEAYIQSLDYIEYVTDLSLLRIAPRTERLFYLDDSETTPIDEFRGRLPWSIAVPSRKHFVNIVDSTQSIVPEPTGYGELEIGTTFILQQDKNNGPAT